MAQQRLAVAGDKAPVVRREIPLDEGQLRAILRPLQIQVARLVTTVVGKRAGEGRLADLARAEQRHRRKPAKPILEPGGGEPGIMYPAGQREDAVTEPVQSSTATRFGNLPDPRVRRTRHRARHDIRVITLCSGICGGRWVHWEPL